MIWLMTQKYQMEDLCYEYVMNRWLHDDYILLEFNIKCTEKQMMNGKVEYQSKRLLTKGKVNHF